MGNVPSNYVHDSPITLAVAQDDQDDSTGCSGSKQKPIPKIRVSSADPSSTPQPLTIITNKTNTKSSLQKRSDFSYESAASSADTRHDDDDNDESRDLSYLDLLSPTTNTNRLISPPSSPSTSTSSVADQSVLESSALTFTQHSPSAHPVLPSTLGSSSLSSGSTAGSFSLTSYDSDGSESTSSTSPLASVCLSSVLQASTSPSRHPRSSHADALMQAQALQQQRSAVFAPQKVSYSRPAATTVRTPAKLTVNHSSCSSNSALNVSKYIETLLAQPATGRARSFCLSSHDIKTICAAAAKVFMSQPVLLELGTPVKVVGDIHGQYGDLLRILQKCGMPPKSNYLFLGDYVDRGSHSLETIMLLFCLKIAHPEKVFLLRGNHECASVTKVYGFYDECKRRASTKVWKTVVDVFNTLPIAATIGGRIFCVHGGLSPNLKSMDDIQRISRPTSVPDSGLLSDLLWSDPDNSIYQWAENDRGVSYCFGKKIVDKFCRNFGFDLIVRGHMVVEDGYEFFARRKLVTVFSAPNYCGDFGNWGAILSVSKQLVCSFELLNPGGL